MKKEMNIALSVKDKIILILELLIAIIFLPIIIYNVILSCYYSFVRNDIIKLNKEYNELSKLDLSIDKINSDIDIKIKDNNNKQDNINKLEKEIKDYSSKINKLKK